MSFYELNIITNNIHKRNKYSWEQTRLIAYIIAQCNSHKKLQLTDIIKFDWDITNKEKDISNKDVLRLQQKAETYIKQIK